MGGEIAIWLALRGSIEARGFLAIGPGGPYMDNLAEWEPVLRDYTHRDLAQPDLRHVGCAAISWWGNRIIRYPTITSRSW